VINIYPFYYDVTSLTMISTIAKSKRWSTGNERDQSRLTR